MPAAFDACISKGGKVRTKDLGHGKYMHICFLNGKSYAGEVKTKQTSKLDNSLKEFKNGEEVKIENINMTKKEVKIEDVFTGEELEKMDGDMKTCVMEQLKNGKSKEDAVKACEMKSKKADEPEVTKADEPKADEPVKEESAKEEAVDQPVADEPEAVAEEEKVEDEAVEGEEVSKELDPIAVLKSISEMSDPNEIREAIQAAMKQLVKTEDGKEVQVSNVAIDVTKQFDVVLKRLDVIESLVKADQPDEPVVANADKGEAVEEGKAEEVSTEDTKPVEIPSDETPAEAPKEEVSAEKPGEEIVKMEGSILSKVDEKLSPVLEALKKIEETVKKLSNQEVPSKIKASSVVEKSFDISEDNQKRINEIKEELAKIDEIKNTNINKFNSERLADKAFRLINERDRLTLGL